MAALVACLCVGVLAPAATADRHRTPTQAQVDAAKATALKKAGDVASLQAQLVLANARLQNAADQAEIAAEAYNGALWRLTKAKQATAAAHAAAVEAAAQAEAQRADIAHLVTQSYLDGPSLDGFRAFLSPGGPSAIMDRWSVARSAGDSMQARFDRYRALTALASVAEAKARAALAAQQQLTRQAATLRDQAAATANIAMSQAAAIAGQRRKLLKELAKAQRVSVALATKREKTLEAIAKQKAATAAAAAAKAKAAKAKADAQHQANQADQTDQELQNLGPEGGWNDPGLPVPAGTSEGATKAIKFAREQLGEPYQWGGAGPDSWDCSGLTMMAWSAGGVSLPHFAAAQYQQSKHLRLGQLQPGDLVFWGTSPNTIHHVALYIGNGQIIHAPHTGDVVRVAGMFDWEPPNFFGRP